MDAAYQDKERTRPLQQAGRSLIERIAGEGEVGGAGSGSETWGHGDPLSRLSPIDLRPLAAVRSASTKDYRDIVDQAAHTRTSRTSGASPTVGARCRCP